MRVQSFKRYLSVFLSLLGISAVAGGVGLLTNTIGIPISDLNGSIFSSYFWPGLILAVIVGGTELVSARMLLSDHEYDIESVAVAGFGLMIWMFTEVCIVGYHSWLQAVYFIFAILILIAAMLLLREI